MKTNRLVYKVQKTFKKMDVCVKISLDDDCKNGVEDFSITGTIYEAGKVHSDKNMLAGGCCHDEILQAFPEFEIFVKLHLANYKGAPMYAIENGFYHLPNKPVAMDYLRISESEYNSLKDMDKLNFSYQLFKLGIVQRWKDEANQAIKELERLTGLEFESKAVNSHTKNLTPEDIALITEREKSGYYSTKAIQDRKKTEIETARQKKYDEIKATFDKAVKIAQNEYDVYKFVLDNDVSIDNMIYYNHTNKLCFNWLSYKSFITVEELTKLQEASKTANLPDGIKIEFSTK